ncbi:unnamed protein product [Urochloa humidicola]
MSLLVAHRSIGVILPPDASLRRCEPLNLLMAESRTQGQMKRTRPQGRRLKPRSEVWKHFTRVIGDDGKEKAECMRCSIQYAIHGTTNQLKHLRECDGKESADGGAAAAPPPQTLPLLPCAPSGSSSMDREPSLDQEEVIQDLVMMTVLNGWNLSIVEDKYFRSFVRRLNPEFRLPSLQAIEEMMRGRILQLQARQRLHENLEDEGSAIPTAYTAPDAPLLMTPATPPFLAARAHELHGPAQPATHLSPAQMQPKKLYGYYGVRQLHSGEWVAEIRQPLNDTLLFLGTFTTAKEAALAYDRAAYRFQGDATLLNFPDNVTSLARKERLLEFLAASSSPKNAGGKTKTAHINLAAASPSNSSSDEDFEFGSVGQVVTDRTEIQNTASSPTPSYVIDWDQML